MLMLRPALLRLEMVAYHRLLAGLQDVAVPSLKLAASIYGNH